MELSEIIEKEDVTKLEKYCEDNKLNTGEQKKIMKIISKSNWDIEKDKDYSPRMKWFWFNISLLRFKNFDDSMIFIDNNLNYFDSWYSVDGTLNFLNRKNISFEKIYSYAKRYVNDKREFVCRFGYFLFFTSEFSDEQVYEIEKLLHDDERYYVQMMEAWLLCEMVIKNQTCGYDVLKRSKLKYNILGKAIQKCLDSYRITDERKMIIKSLREEKKEIN